MSQETPRRTAVPMKCLGIILCESAYRLHRSLNMVIVNTFHTLSVSNCPCKFPKITVLYTVTDGRGHYDMELALVLARSGEDVATWKDSYKAENPLAIGDVHLIFNGVPIPEPGKYWIELRCNGELIGQRPFYVYVTPPNPHKE